MAASSDATASGSASSRVDAQAVLELGTRSVGGGLATAGQAAHPLVETEVEQLDQELLAILRLGVQELGELALRKHDAGGEVLEGQTEQSA